jgi:ATP-dependent Clp protease protease subunit
MERPQTKERTLPEKLFEDRLLFLGEVNSASALEINMRMLYLESLDPKRDIFMFIDSPGGSVSAGLSIYDMMQFIECDVWTICTGMAASMGAFLLGGGTKGKRICFPNSTVMIHQPLRGFGPETLQATEIQIAANQIMRTRDRLNRILAENTGKDVQQVNHDTERDYWMDASECLEYGICDVIAKRRSDISRIAKLLDGCI